MSYQSGIPELDININLDKATQNDIVKTVYTDLEKQTISPTWSPIAPIQGNQHLVTNQQYMKIVTNKNNWSMSKTDQSFAKYKQQLMQGKDPGIRVVTKRLDNIKSQNEKNMSIDKRICKKAQTYITRGTQKVEDSKRRISEYYDSSAY